ncbi:MAG: hypothetical protein NTV51_23330 [Verrucomicrobia bacterium]|nr:hypothetical protein [Verrucomicrobiota bacterium]
MIPAQTSQFALARIQPGRTRKILVAETHATCCTLYCLDGDLRLLWLAEWPLTADPCATIAGVEADVLTAVSVGGVTVRLDTATGRLLDCAAPVAAAS